jgi:integrase
MKVQRAETSLKNINPYTYSVITGLLFTTGLRIGEAVNLTKDDVDLKERTIYVPPRKGARDRIIPISVSTSKVLKAYSKWRESVREDARPFFIFDNPSVKFPDNIYRENFNSITETMGLRTKKPSSRRWRNITVHDLRHTFAVKTLIKAYESKVDIREAIVQLSSVLGHEDIKYTYWYIEQVPELIASAFKRVSS